MIRVYLARPCVVIALLLGASACKEPPNPTDAARPGGLQQPSHARSLEYPADAVDLGQGWHEEQAIKAVATCIDFKTLADTGQEQTMRMSVVTDRSDVMDELDVSAEGQVKSMGYSVTGKARYAKTVEIKAESLNFVAYARVDNGVEYTGPAELGGGVKRIDLTPHYRDLARRDRPAFERECGDGFVSTIYTGAELTAILAFAEQDSAARKTIEAAMKGSGWGFEADGKASATMKDHAGKSQLTISYYQTGGQGNPLPTDQAGFVQAIQTLPALAARDGFNYRIKVQSYRSLPGYPVGEESDERPFRRELATSYGRLSSIRDDVVEILESLESTEKKKQKDKTAKAAPGDNYVDFRRDDLHTRMRELHDEITAKLRQMTKLAAACGYIDESLPLQTELRVPCKLPDGLRAMNDYGYRVRLPVLSMYTSATDPKKPGAEIRDAIIEQYVRNISRRRCARDLEDPGCLLESQIKTLRASLD